MDRLLNFRSQACYREPCILWIAFIKAQVPDTLDGKKQVRKSKKRTSNADYLANTPAVPKLREFQGQFRTLLVKCCQS